MLKALHEADARRQLTVLTHDCGDGAFCPTPRRRHDEHGLGGADSARPCHRVVVS